MEMARVMGWESGMVAAVPIAGPLDDTTTTVNLQVNSMPRLHCNVEGRQAWVRPLMVFRIATLRLHPHSHHTKARGRLLPVGAAWRSQHLLQRACRPPSTARSLIGATFS